MVIWLQCREFKVRLARVTSWIEVVNVVDRQLHPRRQPLPCWSHHPIANSGLATDTGAGCHDPWRDTPTSGQRPATLAHYPHSDP